MSTLSENAKAIFLEAVEKHSPAEWPEFLDQACGDDRDLRGRVEGLLQAHTENDSLFDRVEATAHLEKPSPRTGEQTGPYKLLQALGEGGMGVVYLAERQKPVKQRVALKIIKQGMDTGQFVARFEAERQALAMMDHPNIAKVLDAGCTDDGRPYFVMELVKGVPISQFCDDNRLTTRERLELFTQVCQAVHHAHQKGIIHRDLKPSNVLVAMYDDKPVPKVIDFGVAKATNQQLTEKTLFTEVGSILGTWEYMSPEQAVLNQLDVDTRTDVYSLGVLLYELLTGETPLDRKQLRQAQIMETLRMIREDEPPKPSTRVSSLGNKASTMAAYRRAKPDSLASEIRGDLDWIVMKALAKERSRRYDSASRLAEDVGRYLNHELIEARPPSAWYQLQKLYRRNRVLVSSIVAIMLALATGLGIAIWGVQKAVTREREVQVILNELWDVLADRALDATFSGDTREAFAAIEKAEKADAPEELTGTLRGLVLFFDGQNEQAVRTLEDVLKDHPDSSTAISALSWIYYHTAQYGLHEDTQSRARAIASNPADQTSVYNQFFVCLRAGVEGSRQSVEENLERIDLVLEQKKGWGVALALRARIGAEIAIDDKDLNKFSLALDDFEKAQQLSPNSPMVISSGLFVLLNGMDLAVAEEDERAIAWKTQGLELASAVDEEFADSLGMCFADAFHYRYGDPAAGARLESELVSRSKPGSLIRAAEDYSFDKHLIPIEDWRSDSNHHAKQLCLALSLAASDPTRDEAEQAREIVLRVLRKNRAAAWYAIAMDVALLLGSKSLLTEIGELAEQTGEVDEDWRWWKWAIDFYSGELTQEELLARSAPFQDMLAGAHYLIAMKAVGDRDMETAAEHFKRAVDSRKVTTYPYHSSKVFLERIRSGRDWLATAAN